MSTLNLKNTVFYSALIAFTFLWAGSAYISQMYLLYGLLPSGLADIIALRWNYAAQAAGVLVFLALLRKNPQLLQDRKFYGAGLLGVAVSMLVMLTSDTVPIIVGAGILFNLLIGVYSAWNLSLLAAFVPRRMRGRAYGFAYAGGSLGTYLISLISGGQLLSSSYAVILYGFLVAANLVMIALYPNPALAKEPEPGTEETRSAAPFAWKSLFLIMGVLFLMSLLHSMGSQFQPSSIAEAKVNLEYARAYYAVGLIAAGFLFDKSRKYGAVLCLGSLLYPFVSILMYMQESLIVATWVASYLLFGLFSVYRAVLFMDIAGKSYALLPLAGLGLFSARLGEIANTFVSAEITKNLLWYTLLAAGLFALLLFLFAAMFQKLYVPAEPVPKDKETIYEEFETHYALTGRERDVFRQLVLGYSNTEISSILFVSENTVKFHIKNILRKTGCANRTEVIDRMRRMGGTRAGI